MLYVIMQIIAFAPAYVCALPSAHPQTLTPHCLPFYTPNDELLQQLGAVSECRRRADKG